MTEALAPLLVRLFNLYELTLWCAGAELHAPVCAPVWTSLACALIGGGTLLLIWSAWRIFDYRRKRRAAHAAQAQREAIDYDAIDDAKWRGEHAYGDTTDPDEIERRIRRALDERRREHPTPPATPEDRRNA